MLYSLKLGECIETTPTKGKYRESCSELIFIIFILGFNVESLEVDNRMLTIWDLGGSVQCRELWKHYFGCSQGVIFVVDSTDRDRIFTVRDELQKLKEYADLKDVSLLILLNKQDAEGAFTVAEMKEQIDFESLTFTNSKAIYGVSVLHGNGVTEALHWLVEAINQKYFPPQTLWNWLFAPRLL